LVALLIGPSDEEQPPNPSRSFPWVVHRPGSFVRWGGAPAGGLDGQKPGGPQDLWPVFFGPARSWPTGEGRRSTGTHPALPGNEVLPGGRLDGVSPIGGAWTVGLAEQSVEGSPLLSGDDGRPGCAEVRVPPVSYSTPRRRGRRQDPPQWGGREVGGRPSKPPRDRQDACTERPAPTGTGQRPYAWPCRVKRRADRNASGRRGVCFRGGGSSGYDRGARRSKPTGPCLAWTRWAANGCNRNSRAWFADPSHNGGAPRIGRLRARAGRPEVVSRRAGAFPARPAGCYLRPPGSPGELVISSNPANASSRPGSTNVGPAGVVGPSWLRGGAVGYVGGRTSWGRIGRSPPMWPASWDVPVGPPAAWGLRGCSVLVGPGDDHAGASGAGVIYGRSGRPTSTGDGPAVSTLLTRRRFLGDGRNGPLETHMHLPSPAQQYLIENPGFVSAAGRVCGCDCGGWPVRCSS